MTTREPPASVLEAYGLEPGSVQPVRGGLINETFVAEVGGRPTAVLQHLHPVFGPEVHFDIRAVTEHARARGIRMPQLLPTRSGEWWVVDDQDRVWRALEFVPGRTIHRVEDPRYAHAAGALLGRFHRAVGDLDYQFQSVRSGVHDTASHLARLRAVAKGTSGEIDSLAEAIDHASSELELLSTIGNLPRRVCHGDPKISNFLFADTADDSDDGDDGDVRAEFLVDLDTFGRLALAYELGDALRSWCNPAGEDTADPAIDPAIFRAAIEGYAASAGDFLTDDEWASLVPGLEAVCVELAARFCVDAVEDRYFGWDPQRYPSRRQHNLVRARGQLALAHSARSQRAQLVALVDELRPSSDD